MKKLLFLLSILVFGQVVSAQDLLDIYKSGTVKLVPDTEYAQGNNWGKIFESFSDSMYNKHIGIRKSLVILPDGSAVVSHAYSNYYSLFDPDGRFEKEFGIVRSNGKKFNRTKSIQGVINNNILFTDLDNMGNMLCFDLNGNYKKTLKLNYMSKQMIPLPNNKIAVVGWVIWKTKFRDFVAIVDYETNEQKIIWDHFIDRDKTHETKDVRFQYTYNTKNHGIFSFNTMSPVTSWVGISNPPKIQYIHDKLIVAIPSTGEILIYDINGNQLSKDKTSWSAGFISVEEQKEHQRESIEKIKNYEYKFIESIESDEERRKARESFIIKMEEDLNSISEPIPLPAFSTILKDSDGNLLFFEFPEEDGANKFNVWVYGEKGSFICQSSFICDEYHLEIMPSKMAFHDGYIYSLQVLKESEGIPLRLVRFKVTSN